MIPVHDSRKPVKYPARRIPRLSSPGRLPGARIGNILITDCLYLIFLHFLAENFALPLDLDASRVNP
jgi:hypothetical protein